MKRVLASLAVLLLSLSASADVVTMAQAENVAKNVLGSSSVKYVWNGLGDVRYGDKHPAFYVFNGDEGWAIVSADDCAVPVLMHGEGSFDPDDMPDNMRAILKNIEGDIFAARDRNLAQAPEIRQAWTDFSVMTKAGSSPVEHLLTTASWNQRAPYNYFCPMDGDARSVTGCVATAMAIVMRYYQWPKQAKGTIPGYTTSTKGISVEAKEIDGFEYDWDNMALKYVNSTINPEVQQVAVARLMEHCGAMVEMDYASDGSGAYSADIAPAMKTYMSYSTSAKELYRRNFSNTEWFSMIKSEIDALHPVIYGGQDTNGAGGHQFVCDGYNSSNEVHINWGWGGSCNAWYAVCFLGSSNESDPGYTGYVFSLWDSAIFGLYPDGSDDWPDDPVLETGANGLSLESGAIAKGGDFTIKLSGLKSASAYSGSLKAALLDMEGNVREYISVPQAASLAASVTAEDCTFDCSISQDIHVGDYVSILYSCSGSTWKPVSILNKATPSRISAMDFTLIDIPSAVNAGYRFYPSLLLGQKSTSSVTWFLDGTQTTSEYITLTAGGHTIKAVIVYKDGSTETIVKKVTVN
ncbi:MAG: C10 family peptidase [Bacteroidales bacterium]|nr:C10 family peptidase [Bacteroidales bacterium]